MGIERVSKNVYSIGVINPSLRIFDIVMKANYGTSYNSYFITGDKNVVIDTVHNDFFSEYINNLQSITDLNEIDYIILNHTEPDHSGSLRKLLEMVPNAKIICTTAGHKYLKQIMNMDFDATCVKDGETLDIGNGNLRFIVSPMLHWPDSMMTWFEKDGILFSCDFLGAHFCEPALLDTEIHYQDEYLSEFKNYYNGIFGPFKKFVLSGLEKLKNLDINAICPSHGPFLTKTIKSRMNDYHRWSLGNDSEEKFILVLFASAYGFTRKLAEEAVCAINISKKVKAKLLDVVKTPIDKISEDITKSCGLMVGSCTINRDAPKIIWDVLASVDAINSRGKPAGAFGSYGWSGEAVNMIAERMKGLGFRLNESVVKVNFMPTEDNLVTMRNYAKDIAESVIIKT